MHNLGVLHNLITMPDLIIDVEIVDVAIVKHQPHNCGWRIDVHTLEFPCLVSASFVTIQRQVSAYFIWNKMWKLDSTYHTMRHCLLKKHNARKKEKRNRSRKSWGRVVNFLPRFSFNGNFTANFLSRNPIPETKATVAFHKVELPLFNAITCSHGHTLNRFLKRILCNRGMWRLPESLHLANSLIHVRHN